ncbi:MAG: alpha/beta fold hydrolase [Candidatus Velthaea sp.]
MQKTIDGVRIAYDDAGQGDAIVLLHGFPLDRTIWDAQFAALAKRARVIRPDLRGSGESGTGEGPALMETLAGDVFGLIEALGIERVTLAGHSIGSYAALAFFRMYAERVAGLALIGGHVAADTPQLLPGRDALAARVAAEGIEPAVQAYWARYFNPRFYKDDTSLVDLGRTIMRRQNAAGAAAQIVGMKERVGSEDLLEDIDVPVLIVAGETDDWITPQSLERTSNAIKDSEYVLLRGVGHMPMMEAPDDVTAALERLLDRVRAKSTVVR